MFSHYRRLLLGGGHKASAYLAPFSRKHLLSFCRPFPLLFKCFFSTTSLTSLETTLLTDRKNVRGRTSYRFWTEAEDQALLKHVDEYGAKYWFLAAIAVGNGRDSLSCRSRYLNSLNPTIEKRRWNKDEEAILLQGVQTYGTDFVKVSTLLPHRTSRQCRLRFQRLIKIRQNKRGHFTKEEDDALRKSLKKHGTFNWTNILKEMPYPRDIYTVYYRWLSLMRSEELKKSGTPSRKWSKEEDEKLLTAIKEVNAETVASREVNGSRWRKIAEKVGTRDDGQCYRRASYLEEFWNSGRVALKRDSPISKPPKWTEEEKVKLLELVEKAPKPIIWRDITKKLTNKTRYSAYACYYLKVDPSVNHGDWSLEEMRRLRDGIKEHGREWRKVAGVVKTRNHVQCRYHYMSLTMCDARKRKSNLYLEGGDEELPT